MWEGWNKYVDTDDCKRYELLIGSSEIKVLLGVCLTKIESDPLTFSGRTTGLEEGIEIRLWK
jgi:hypothetical protein